MFRDLGGVPVEPSNALLRAAVGDSLDPTSARKKRGGVFCAAGGLAVPVSVELTGRIRLDRLGDGTIPGLGLVLGEDLYVAVLIGKERGGLL